MIGWEWMDEKGWGLGRASGGWWRCYINFIELLILIYVFWGAEGRSERGRMYLSGEERGVIRRRGFLGGKEEGSVESNTCELRYFVTKLCRVRYLMEVE